MPINELGGGVGLVVSGFSGYKVMVSMKVCWYKVMVSMKVCWYKVGLKLSLS